MKTHVEIKRPAFSRFLKAEVAEFASKAIDIVHSQDPDELLINPVFDPLVALQPEIRLLSVRFGIDSERMKVETLKSTMLLEISNLKLQLRLASKSNSGSDVHVVGNQINAYLRNLNKTKNDKVLVQRVEGFLGTTKTDALFSEALLSLKLTGAVGAIKSALIDLRRAMSNRSTILSERPNIKTKAIITNISNAVHNLLKGVEIAQLMNTELNYKPLIDELNELVGNFRLSVRLRVANNRRKAEQAKQNNPEDSDTEFEDEEQNAEMQTTSAMPRNGFTPYHLSVESEANEVDSWDDWDESFDDELEGNEEFSEEAVEGSVEGGEEEQ